MKKVSSKDILGAKELKYFGDLICTMNGTSLSKVVMKSFEEQGLIHTSYLSQTPQTCLCKSFLSGVNFSRLSEKNAYI